MKNALLRLLLVIGFLAALSECRNRDGQSVQDEKIKLELARQALTEKLKNDREHSDDRAIVDLVDGIPDDTLREWLRTDSTFAAELRRLEHRPDPGIPKGATPR